MPKLDIPTDLYVSLQNLREPSDRGLDDVIWRLVTATGAKRPGNSPDYRVIETTEGLFSGGTVIPNGLSLRMRYKKKTTYGKVSRGKLRIGKKSFESPSAAARWVAAQQGAKNAAQSINGWDKWEFETPDGSGQWRSLDSLRPPWEVRRRNRRR